MPVPSAGVSKHIPTTRGADEMTAPGGNSSPILHLLSSQYIKALWGEEGGGEHRL